MDEITKAYLAGLIDADGHISILRAVSGRKKPQYWLQVGITQSDESFLKIIRKKIGAGKIYRNNKARTNNFNSRERYQLQIFGKDAAKLLGQLYDF